ncbi:hypothetical protein [Streptacidiphilus cavernicola]|uniref:Uncharacterized protein n=1 Tax=Streptacidiphilus cavernicola TaxID=3342716 RepID=A0ABV6VPZ0_9ACTN
MTRVLRDVRTVSVTVRSILVELRLPTSEGDQRRVLAVLTYLDAL